MIEHTPEPWMIGDGNTPFYAWAGQILADHGDGEFVLASCNQNYPEDAVSNARRIVACVNACAGLTTETLETFTTAIPSGFVHALEQVKHERDEARAAHQARDAEVAMLREALDKAVNVLENVRGVFDPEQEQDPIESYLTICSRVNSALGFLKFLASNPTSERVVSMMDVGNELTPWRRLHTDNLNPGAFDELVILVHAMLQRKGGRL